jgi:hypothetical protein
MRKLVFLMIIALAFTACSGSSGDDGRHTEPSLPALTGTVSITGSAEVGQILTANTGSLSGNGDISYQWKRGTVNIGTNSNTYTVQYFDVGSTITVTVTRSGYTGSITSPAIGPITTANSNISDVIFNSVTADGDDTKTTTVLTLTFSKAITGLTADDISLSGVSGVSKGTLSGSGPVYTLPISGFTVGGTLNVAVTKPGYYYISGSTRTTTIYYSGGSGNTSVTFNRVTANGSSSQTTTALTLTFSQAITELTADDITLSGVSGVQKGSISGSGTTYTLPISGFTAGGTLNVVVTKSGYTISGSSKTVSIYYYSLPTVGIVIDLAGIAGINEWDLIEQTAQIAFNNYGYYEYFVVTETYATYRWYLDGVFVGTSSSYYFYNKPAGVYQLIVVVTNSSGESRSGRCRITVNN